MSDLKISFFRIRVGPFCLGDGHDGRLHLIPLTQVMKGEERRNNVKCAWFFATVAVVCVLSDLLGHFKNSYELSSNPAPWGQPSLTLSLVAPVKNGARCFVQFGLSNRGNHPFYYSVPAESSSPVGEILTRTSSLSEWTSVPDNSQQLRLAPPSFEWIEMPPGGWIDGKFFDTCAFSGDHAYAIYVKPTQKSEMVRFVSEPYRGRVN